MGSCQAENSGVQICTVCILIQLCFINDKSPLLLIRTSVQMYQTPLIQLLHIHQHQWSFMSKGVSSRGRFNCVRGHMSAVSLHHWPTAHMYWSFEIIAAMCTFFLLEQNADCPMFGQARTWPCLCSENLSTARITAIRCDDLYDVRWVCVILL